MRETGEKRTTVDKVEFLAEEPLVFGVVDHELAVWRDELGLDRGEVGAYYVGAGVLFSVFNGPETGAGCDVEDVLRVGDRCCGESAVHCHSEEMVLEV